jgi:hypothetical protein
MTMRKTILSGAIAGMFLVLGLCARCKLGAANAAATRVWIEAEDFADKGAWKVETQFTHLMGSAYLIASETNLVVLQSFRVVGTDAPRRLAETAIRDLQKTLLADDMLIPQMEH